jgi:hypothetical protein
MHVHVVCQHVGETAAWCGRPPAAHRRRDTLVRRPRVQPSRGVAGAHTTRVCGASTWCTVAAGASIVCVAHVAVCLWWLPSVQRPASLYTMVAPPVMPARVCAVRLHTVTHPLCVVGHATHLVVVCVMCACVCSAFPHAWMWRDGALGARPRRVGTAGDAG